MSNKSLIFIADYKIKYDYSRFNYKYTTYNKYLTYIYLYKLIYYISTNFLKRLMPVKTSSFEYDLIVKNYRFNNII